VLQRPLQLDGPVSSATSFDPAWHWDNIFLDVPPFAYLAETLRPGRVGDFGCGIGAYLNVFKEICGANIVGYDGIPAGTTVLDPDEYEQVDLSAPLDVDGNFELSLCVEVVEHLADADAQRLIAVVADVTTSTVVFSAAEPGQPGNGHITCRPLAEWLNRWAVLGWHPDLVETLGLRALSTLCWLRRNLVVLKQKSGAGAESKALIKLASRQYHWHSQATGIRRHAFHDPLPEPPLGYESASMWLREVPTTLSSEEATRMIETLDIDVFRIETQTSSSDRTSLLRVQKVVRSLLGKYVYLEIGSHLGGSLFPHLIDSACVAAISIDPRPPAQGDERAEVFCYKDNSTRRMRRALSAHLSQLALAKLTTIESDVSAVGAGVLDAKASLVLIDAEHTNVACFSDFVGIMGLVKPDCMVVFHDANLIADAICNAERFLDHLGIVHETVFLPDSVAVLGLGVFAAAVGDEFGPLGMDRNSFLDRSRRQLWAHIANTHTAELHAQVEQLRDDKTRLIEERDKANEAMRETEALLSAVTSSTIWRASRPVRAVVTRVKRGLAGRM
jgi:SAM-dependent methyltransferase